MVDIILANDRTSNCSMETNYHYSDFKLIKINSVCRYCLNMNRKMRKLSINDLIQSEIPRFYEKVTALQLEISESYPESICTQCEYDIKHAAETRQRLIKIDVFWKQYLLKIAVGESMKEATEKNLKTIVDSKTELVKECQNKNYSHDLPHISENKDKINQIIKMETEYLIESDIVVNTHNLKNDEHVAISSNQINTTPRIGKIYKCTVCDKDYKSSSGLNQHVRRQHTTNTSLSCDMCTEIFQNKYSLLKHLRNHRGKNHICDICKRKFLSAENLSAHVKSHILVECNLCEEHFNTPHQFSQHIRRIHPNNSNIFCSICNDKFSDQKSIVDHLIEHANKKTYKCFYCEKVFVAKQHVHVHERIHTGDAPYICEICGSSFTQISGLNCHLKVHLKSVQGVHRTRENNSDLLKCEICDVTYKHKRSLISHMEIKHRILIKIKTPKKTKRKRLKYTIDRLTCDFCQKTFGTARSMHFHLITKDAHGIKGVLEWENMLNTVCMKCNKKISSSLELKLHKKTHANFHCEVCKMGFGNAQTLEYHKKKHSAIERPFKCNECGSTHTNKSNLRQHYRRNHTTDRPYVCSYCDKGFAQNYEMVNHIKQVHTKDRPEKCELCNKTFITRGKLSLHMRKHFGIKQSFNCKLCNQNFEIGTNLTYHNLKYHSTENI